MSRPIDADALESDLQEEFENLKEEKKQIDDDVAHDLICGEINENRRMLKKLRTAPTLTLNLNTLRDEVYADAVAHGLYEGEYDVPELERAAPGLMYRIQDEVREAWNAALDWQQGKEGAKEHVAEELADIIITALSVSGHLGIDIHAALFRKKEINKKRSFKHKEEA